MMIKKGDAVVGHRIHDLLERIHADVDDEEALTAEGKRQTLVHGDDALRGRAAYVPPLPDLRPAPVLRILKRFFDECAVRVGGQLVFPTLGQHGPVGVPVHINRRDQLVVLVQRAQARRQGIDEIPVVRRSVEIRRIARVRLDFLQDAHFDIVNGPLHVFHDEPGGDGVRFGGFFTGDLVDHQKREKYDDRNGDQKDGEVGQ
ncbi:hypothetical protein OMP38_09845 [Cohnella ginsengisoli]|uniref:Uncharacterized protein n=1 Tax=Cohnella ginsengisoli TaxID=425004 RepID=A0A9X4KFT0_9BACL|nr:hypothetical protein [Cohnella ginsengisoli]MDG0791140.1 hypothetical protein [Cohnella ginsengisoli]